VRKTLAILLAALALAAAVPSAAKAAGDERQLVRIKAKVRYVEFIGAYALLGDDGKKYHPTKKLPRHYQKEGLEVVVEARLRPDFVGVRMYGTAVEVLQIVKADDYISPEERVAVKLLLARMAAFNAGDLVKLREIDAVALRLSREQFETWVAGWGDFTLHYVEATNIFGPKRADAVIEGICLYSRKRVNSMAISGDVQYTLMKFTLAKSGDVWKFTATDAYRPDPALSMEQVVGDYLARAKQRYGTANLAGWKS